MGVEVTDEMKANGEKTEKGYSVTALILGTVMLAVGFSYLPQSIEPHSSSSAAVISEGRASVPSKESDPCPNGTAYYLYVAGITILVTTFVNIASKYGKYLAEKDGKVTCGEQCGLNILGFASVVLVITYLVMLIWGSVLVFGTWPYWTSNYEKYAGNPEKYNYCARTPMITALVILIIKWLMIPLMICLACCCTCLCSMCAVGLGFLGLKTLDNAVKGGEGSQEGVGDVKGEA